MLKDQVDPGVKLVVIRPVYFNELAKAFSAQSELMKCPALFARESKTVFLHLLSGNTFAKCVRGRFQTVLHEISNPCCSASISAARDGPKSM